MRYLTALLLSLMISCGGSSGSTAYDICFYWASCAKTVSVLYPDNSNARMCQSKAATCALQCSPNKVTATDCEARALDINIYCSEYVKESCK